MYEYFGCSVQRNEKLEMAIDSICLHDSGGLFFELGCICLVQLSLPFKNWLITLIYLAEHFFNRSQALTFVAVSRIIIIALCLVVMAQSFQRTWIVTSWKVNRNYIAANLCENKAVKTSKCAGACYLKKQLKAQEQKEQSLPISEKDKSDFICNLLVYTINRTIIPTHSSTAFPNVWTCGKPNHIGFSIFHPPSFLG